MIGDPSSGLPIVVCAFVLAIGQDSRFRYVHYESSLNRTTPLPQTVHSKARQLPRFARLGDKKNWARYGEFEFALHSIYPASSR
ncbi:hypothetical protein [Paraburkholderia terrae]|uniref:hypothetical protein n=1 Tax=Paraburkholderia terrae TaxID=311230 RepID=UPI0033654E93